MEIHFDCPGCQRHYHADPRHAGRALRCKKCGQVLEVPRLGRASAPPSVPTGQPVRPGRPRRRLAWVSVALVLLAGAGTGAFLYFQSSGGEPVTQTPPKRQPDQGPGQVGEKQTEQARVFEKIPGPTRTLEWEFEYDPVSGEVSKVIDPADRQTVTRREKDAKTGETRVVRELPDGKKVVQTFDRFGRRTALQDPAGVTRYQHDGFGRLTEVARAGSPPLRYAYDGEGRVRSLSLGKELTVRYAYDFLGRVARVETPAGPITYDHRTGLGKVIRTLPNKVQTFWAYRPDGKLESITHAKDGLKLTELTYAYRPDGLLLEVKEWTPKEDRTTRYEYDSVKRLVAVHEGAERTTRYEYDAFGNRTKRAGPDGKAIVSAYDWAGRLLRHGGRDCAHDDAGNLTGYTGSKGTAKLTYTSENLLASVKTAAGEVSYRHDGDGNLVARVAGGRQTTFVPDPQTDIWRPLLAVGEGGKEELYLWEGDVPLGVLAGGEAKFFLHDHLGSVRCVADREGKVIARKNYCPFGVCRQPLQAGAFEPGFAGLFADGRAGLYLTRARGYDPYLGRFLQQDPQHRTPIDVQQDLATYVYCGGDPVNHTDTNGAAPIKNDFPPPNNWQNRPDQQRWYDVPLNFLGRATGSNWIGRNVSGGDRHIYLRDPLREVPLGNPRIPARFLGDSIARWHDIQSHVNTHFSRGTEIFVRGPNGRAEFYTSQGGRRIAGLGWADLGLARRLAPYATPIGAALLLSPGMRLAPRQQAQTAHPIPMPSWMISPPPGREKGERRDSRLQRRDQFSPRPPPPPGGGASALSPGRIGGISLRGAGDALKDLGPLQGVAVDANGRLVLITAEKGDLKLPPLRLDDVVTVFRCVYQHGAPFVSIDPDPEKPRGLEAVIRLGPGTDGTYVGWILYQADRIMKCYRMGEDSYTGKRIETTIPGWEKTQDELFAIPPAKKSKEDIRNRFWIVPASAKRLQTKDGRLTLLEVPLKLETELSVVRAGKLMAVPGGKAPRDALGYCKWFTAHYQDLAKEVRLAAPAGSGVEGEVPIFEELQRIALLVGLAERLRDQGVPLPGWVQDFAVRPFPVPKRTPMRVLTSTRTVKGKKYQLAQYGGVTLAPPPTAVQTIEGAEQAEALAPALEKALAAAPALRPVAFEHAGKQYRAVALPGRDTQALGAVRLDETDLRVAAGNGELVLTRAFNSFLPSADAFGKGWSLDLPRLEKSLRETPVGGGKVLRTPVYQLRSPLQTYAEHFSELKVVPGINRTLLAPRGPSAMLGVAPAKDGGAALYFRDGRVWQFDAVGRLVARRDASFVAVYRWDEAGRLSRIEGGRGGTRAAIVLKYDAGGRLESAHGSDGTAVRYGVDAAGMLVRVEGPGGTTGYRYRAGRVTEILAGAKVVRRFVYSDTGALQQELDASGKATAYTVRAEGEGIRITAAGPAGAKQTALYDRAFRPLSRVLADGTEVKWKYGKGTVKVTATLPDGTKYEATRAAGGERRSWTLPEGGTYRTEHDEAGRVTAEAWGDRVVVRRAWWPDGRLKAAVSDTVKVEPGYSADGALEDVTLAAPGAGPQSPWLTVRVDAEGRPTALKDYSHSDLKIAYDPAGAPKEVVFLHAKKEARVQIRRNAAGQVEAVATSWGLSQRSEYDPKEKGGGLRRRELSQGEHRTVVEFDGGRPGRVLVSEGKKLLAETQIDYVAAGPARGQPRSIRTPGGLVLTYDYDGAGRIRAVNCGDVYRLEYRYDGRGRLRGLAQVPLRKQAG